MGEPAVELERKETQGAEPKAQLKVMEKLPTLYDLTAEVAAILDAEEAAPDDLERLALLLPSIERKAAALAHFIEMTEDLASTLKAREQSFGRLRKSAEAKADRARGYVKLCMELAEIRKVTDRDSGTTVALQNNPPHADPTDLDAIPRRFWIQPETPALVLDKRALLEALKLGPVPGAELKQDCRVVIK